MSSELPTTQPQLPKIELETKFLKTFDPSEWFALSSGYNLETKTGTFKGYHIQPKLLSQPLKNLVVDMLYPIAMSAFAQKDSAGFKKDVSEHVLNNSDVLLIMEGDKAVAFRMWDTLDIPEGKLVYLAGMCIDSEYQGKGLGSEMLEYVNSFSNQLYPTWKYMVLRTQNSVMQKTFRNFAQKQGVGEIFEFGSTNVPDDVKNVALAVADKNNDTKLDPETLLSKGAYGSSLYGSQAGVGEKNEGTSLGEIEQEKGDAVYSVWRK